MRSMEGSSGQWEEHDQQMVLGELPEHAPVNPGWTKGPDEKRKETNHERLGENREELFHSHTKGKAFAF